VTRSWPVRSVQLGGPIRGPEHRDQATLEAAFREQIDGLLEGGVDLLLFETFSDLDELLAAISVARGCDRPAGHGQPDVR